jgi:hypothetical protein
MSPDGIGAVIGGVVSGGAASAVVIVKWLWPAMNAFKKDVKDVKAEIGVGTVGPSIVDLVSSTATAVQRLEHSSQRNGEGIHHVIETLNVHGERLGALEVKHEALSNAVGRFRDAFTARDDDETDGGGVRRFKEAFAAHDLLESNKRKRPAIARKTKR